jgi:hypothetical protein
MVVTSRTRLAAALAVVAVSVALPFARTPASPARPAPTVTFNATGMSFRYPATWHAVTWSNEVSSFAALIVYLSTSPMNTSCKVMVNPGLRSAYCPYPLAELPPGGILVRWQADGFPGSRTPKLSTRIGGHPAIETETSQDGWCQALEGTEAIIVMIPRPVPGNWYEMDACLRPPNFPQQEAQIASLLSTVQFAGDN